MKYEIQVTNWKKNGIALSKIRREVFIEEQNVPEELEWDEFDNECIHILVTSESNLAITCGRLKPDGHIGRMAVLKNYRKTGIGTATLLALLKSAQKMNLNRVYLHSQITAIPFYEKQGFETTSEIFMDANIPHKTMEKHLKSDIPE